MIKKHKRLYQFTAILLGLIVVMVLGFMLIEQIPLYKSLWMTVISVLAVGYGDLVPKTNIGKAFSMLLIPITMGFSTYMLTYIAASMVEGRLSKKWERKKMDNQIKKLNGHYIICGYDRVGEQVFKEFQDYNRDIVIVLQDEVLKDRIPQEVPYIIGDAKKNEILQKAGIERAKGLIATAPDDATNVFITLSARGLQTELEIIARAEEGQTIDKLKRAGADHVVNPSDLGGRRMALSLIKPASMYYVDSIIHAKSSRFQIEEYQVDQNSPLNGGQLMNLELKSRYGITLLGIQRNQEFISNPKNEEIISENDILIIFGDCDNLGHLFNDIK